MPDSPTSRRSMWWRCKWLDFCCRSKSKNCRHLVRRRNTGDERDFRGGLWGRSSGKGRPAPVDEESGRCAGLRSAAIGIQNHGPDRNLSGQILLRRLLREPTTEAKDQETGRRGSVALDQIRLPIKEVGCVER